MAKSSRRPQQMFTIVMWLLSVVFAGFLIGLGGLIIKDLPQVDRAVTLEQFVDPGKLRPVTTRKNAKEAELTGLRRAIEDAETDYDSARADTNAAEASFEAWLATRSVTENSAQDPEVIQRNRVIDNLKVSERAAQRNLEDARGDLRTAEREIEDMRRQISDIRNEANPKYRAAMRGQELRVFAMRLAVTLPLLLIGGWLLKTRRGSPYWPLYRGFVLFALFAFFVELVPYLPHYGGYVRYLVGIILVVVAGHFIIAAMRKYMARKQIEESRSESERRQSIEYETALKKIAAKTCPGCDRAIIRREGVDTDFCVHCGIRLQEKCGGCGNRNISFHRFCLSCGEPSASHAAVDPANA